MAQPVVWITGASSGIGEGLALHYAANGWIVAATARRQEVLTALASKNAAIKPYAGDVTDPAAMQKIVESIVQQYGTLDRIILNAGTHIRTDGMHLTIESFQTLMQINFLGVAHCLVPAVEKMKQQQAGQVVIVSSVAGLNGLPSAAAYGATKAALLNMAEALKVELEAAGITISVVMPGFVKTPLTDKNEFAMPFIMEVDAAVQRIVSGIEKQRFAISFPKRLAWFLRLMRCLPYPIQFAITRKMVGKS